MIYSFIKIFIKIALQLFCKKIHITGKEHLQGNGPTLILANHPNSFLDGILIAAFAKHPVHFLARGDAFRKPLHKQLLSLLNLIPVHRLREGREHLELNYETFDRCKEILSNDGIVLLFIEGVCVNKNELQPFRKGAARIAFENKAFPNFQIIPAGLAFNSFSEFGKTVNLQVLPPIPAADLLNKPSPAKTYLFFNEQLYQKINSAIQLNFVEKGQNPLVQALIQFFGFFGWLLHQPIYWPIKTLVKNQTNGTVFYDSVLFGLLFFLYPIYLLLLFVLVNLLGLNFINSLIFLFLHPLLGWLAVKR